MKTIIYFSIHDYRDNYKLSYKYTHNNRTAINNLEELEANNTRLKTVFCENKNNIMNYVIKGNEYSKPYVFTYYFSPDSLHQHNFQSVATVTIDKVDTIL